MMQFEKSGAPFLQSAWNNGAQNFLAGLTVGFDGRGE